jgi:hypothetical protein
MNQQNKFFKALIYKTGSRPEILLIKEAAFAKPLVGIVNAMKMRRRLKKQGFGKFKIVLLKSAMSKSRRTTP